MSAGFHARCTQPSPRRSVDPATLVRLSRLYRLGGTQRSCVRFGAVVWYAARPGLASTTCNSCKMGYLENRREARGIVALVRASGHQGWSPSESLAAKPSLAADGGQRPVMADLLGFPSILPERRQRRPAFDGPASVAPNRCHPLPPDTRIERCRLLSVHTVADTPWFHPV